MFHLRDHSLEIMDDTSIRGERLDIALRELNVINKFLGGNAVTRAGLEELKPSLNDDYITILDAGSGGGLSFPDIKFKAPIKHYSLDKNPGACRFIKNNRGNGKSICGDVKALPFKNKSFSITHASLLLHHFDETDLVEILESFVSLSREGIIINDLRRSIRAFMGIKILTTLFSRSEMVKNDGPLSVKKGFTFQELTALMKKLKISRYTLRKKWAFRWLLVIFIR